MYGKAVLSQMVTLFKLHTQVSDWLSRAEKIKAYLEVRKLNTLDTSQSEEDENTRLATSSKYKY